MGKKGQGLPLNTIIIAIIVLVVLVVLVAVFTGRIGGFETDLSKQSDEAKVQAEALRSFGTVEAGESCGIPDPENPAGASKTGLCSQPTQCAFGDVLRVSRGQSQPVCVQGLVCCGS